MSAASGASTAADPSVGCVWHTCSSATVWTAAVAFAASRIQCGLAASTMMVMSAMKGREHRNGAEQWWGIVQA
eukprot:161041-Amphidinium_carterae.1